MYWEGNFLIILCPVRKEEENETRRLNDNIWTSAVRSLTFGLAAAALFVGVLKYITNKKVSIPYNYWLIIMLSVWECKCPFNGICG